ncbi:MAG: sortase, partial [Aeromicrobium sp.]
GTRETSFRSPRSLREQRAAVPGRPGVEPTRAMITLSTCATLEDHAAGNYWSDEFDNPEHRIDKIGVLVRVDRT